MGQQVAQLHERYMMMMMMVVMMMMMMMVVVVLLHLVGCLHYCIDKVVNNYLTKMISCYHEPWFEVRSDI